VRFLADGQLPLRLAKQLQAGRQESDTPIDVASHASDLPGDSVVVVISPDGGSPEAFRAFVDELLAGPEPELETIGAAEALHELRADAKE
jgi:hypothetical protein